MSFKQLSVDDRVDSLVEALRWGVLLARLFTLSFASFLLDVLMEILQALEREIGDAFFLVVGLHHLC